MAAASSSSAAGQITSAYATAAEYRAPPTSVRDLTTAQLQAVLRATEVQLEDEAYPQPRSYYVKLCLEHGVAEVSAADLAAASTMANLSTADLESPEMNTLSLDASTEAPRPENAREKAEFYASEQRKWCMLLLALAVLTLDVFGVAAASLVTCGCRCRSDNKSLRSKRALSFGCRVLTVVSIVVSLVLCLLLGLAAWRDARDAGEYLDVFPLSVGARLGLCVLVLALEFAKCSAAWYASLWSARLVVALGGESGIAVLPVTSATVVDAV